jgi:hypothetical protein
MKGSVDEKLILPLGTRKAIQKVLELQIGPWLERELFGMTIVGIDEGKRFADE